MEIFLAKLIGFYFIIMAIITLLRQKSMMSAVKGLADSKMLVMIIGIIEIIAGLALAIAYPVVSMSLEGILSLVGYVLVIEGIVYVVAPARFMHKAIRFFNNSTWYGIGALVAIVGGIYLAGSGFGLF